MSLRPSLYRFSNPETIQVVSSSKRYAAGSAIAITAVV